MRSKREVSEICRRVRPDGDLNHRNVLAARLLPCEPIEPLFIACGRSPACQLSVALLHGAQIGGRLEGNEGVEAFVLPQREGSISMLWQ
jgi:hypothetical protein